MNSWRSAAATVAIAVGLIAGAACGDEADGEASESTVTTYPPTPTPSADEAEEIETAVAGIYPGVPAGKAADWARSTCGDMLRDGLEGKPLIERIQRRFTGRDRPEPTSEQAQAILEVIEAGDWCA